MSSEGSLQLGAFEVHTTSHKGHDPDFWAELAANRIINIGSNAHPIIAQQAEAFKRDVLQTISYYMKEAIKSDRTTLIAQFEKQGQQEMADILRRL